VHRPTRYNELIVLRWSGLLTPDLISRLNTASIAAPTTSRSLSAHVGFRHAPLRFPVLSCRDATWHFTVGIGLPQSRAGQRTADKQLWERQWTLQNNRF